MIGVSGGFLLNFNFQFSIFMYHLLQCNVLSIEKNQGIGGIGASGHRGHPFH